MTNKQKLGINVFYYYLSKRITIGIFLLVISIVVSSYEDSLVSRALIIFPSTTAILVVNYFIYTLYAASIALILYGIIASIIKYTSCDFTLGENAFSIRRGFFTKKEVSIPYRQIQNINIEQTIKFKIMGVSKLMILTPGYDNGEQNGESEGVFEMIDSKLAQSIKEFILQKSNVQTVDDSNI